jgi:hypothetical protein
MRPTKLKWPIQSHTTLYYGVISTFLRPWRPTQPIFRLRPTQFEFAIEVTTKGRHHLTHPHHEIRFAHSLERSRGKVVGLKMKGGIPTTAESIYIGRAKKCRDTLIVQMQTSKAFYDNVKASIPIVHEVTAGAGEYLECSAIRILWRRRLRFLKRDQVGLKMMLHPRCCHEIAMKGENRREAHAETIRLPRSWDSSFQFGVRSVRGSKTSSGYGTRRLFPLVVFVSSIRVRPPYVFLRISEDRLLEVGVTRL